MKQTPAKHDEQTPTHKDAVLASIRALQFLAQFGTPRLRASFVIGSQVLERAIGGARGADAVGRARAAGCGCDAPPLGNTGGTVEGRA